MARSLEFPEVSPKLVFSERGEIILAMTANNDAVELSPLHVELLKRFDGKTELAEISRQLSEKFGEELSVEDIAEFLPLAKQLGMLSLRYAGPADDEVAKKRCPSVLRRLKAMALPPTTFEPMLDGLALQVTERLKAKDPRGALAAAYALSESAGDKPWVKRLVEVVEALGEPRAFGEMNPALKVIPLTDPSETLKRMDRYLGWIYSPLGLAIWLAFVLAGVWACTTLPWPKADTLLNPVVITLFYTGTILGILLHEYAHALTCTHYGAPVRRIGIGLLAGVMLIFWADVTPSYLIKERWKRLLVLAAGSMAGMLYLSGAALLCLVLPPENLLRQALLPMIVVGVVNQVVFNVVPFVELDGYFFMCELFGEKNLKARALELRWALVRRFFVGDSVELPEPELPKRTFRLMIFYLVGRFLFFCWFAVGLADVLYTNLVGAWRGYGLALLVALLSLLVAPAIVGSVRSLFQFVFSHRRLIVQRKNLPRVALTAAGLTVLLFGIPFEESAEATLLVAPAKKLEVRAMVRGQVMEVLVRTGDRVRAGQPLAKMASRELALDEVRAQADVKREAALLLRLEHGATPEELRISRAVAQAHSADYRAVAAEAERSRQLRGSGAISRAENETRQLTRVYAAARLGVARQSQELVEAGTREEDLAAAKARLQRAEAALELIRGNVSRLVLTSPMDGVVSELFVEELQGRFLNVGDKLLTVQSPDRFVGTLTAPWVPDPEALVGSRTRLYFPTGDVVDVKVDSVAMKLAANEPISIETAPFSSGAVTAGMKGNARLYGARVPLAVEYLWHPAKRFFVVELWSSL